MAWCARLVVAFLATLACACFSMAMADRISGVEFAQLLAADEEWQPSKQQIHDVQVRLKALGFRLGEADGILGPRTTSAIQAYQSSIDVATDGKLTKDLYDRLLGKTVSTDQPVAAPPEPPKPEEPQASKEQATCWDIADAGGGSIELALLADGSVSGPPYPEHWRWQATDQGVSIMYDNGMGLTVTRTGVLEGNDKMVGNAMDSRGRSWTWTAKQMGPPAEEDRGRCPSQEPATKP